MSEKRDTAIDNLTDTLLDIMTEIALSGSVANTPSKLRDKLQDTIVDFADALVDDEPAQKQTSGPQCKRCGAFTTYTRVRSHGLCMRCETAENRG